MATKATLSTHRRTVPPRLRSSTSPNPALRSRVSVVILQGGAQRIPQWNGPCLACSLPRARPHSHRDATLTSSRRTAARRRCRWWMSDGLMALQPLRWNARAFTRASAASLDYYSDAETRTAELGSIGYWATHSRRPSRQGKANQQGNVQQRRVRRAALT
ncbi:hypothetical protein SVAN01_07574 [Stagonosporopsis vannaccii]|nr:hypothetical protein SVAN01_07574 [Stagonosporopsis vannaccii]